MTDQPDTIKPDYESYKNKTVWNTLETACILCELEPRLYFMKDREDPRYDEVQCLKPKVEFTKDIVKSWLDSGDVQKVYTFDYSSELIEYLPNLLPGSALSFAHSKGYEIPEELQGLFNSNQQSPTTDGEGTPARHQGDIADRENSMLPEENLGEESTEKQEVRNRAQFDPDLQNKANKLADTTISETLDDRPEFEYDQELQRIANEYARTYLEDYGRWPTKAKVATLMHNKGNHDLEAASIERRIRNEWDKKKNS